MPMDGLTLGFIARELQETLRDARVEKVTQPEKDMLLLALRNNGQNYKLILSASPSLAVPAEMAAEVTIITSFPIPIISDTALTICSILRIFSFPDS